MDVPSRPPPAVCEPCDPPLRGWGRAAHVRSFRGLLGGLTAEYLAGLALLTSTDERRRSLQETWGFHCR